MSQSQLVRLQARDPIVPRFSSCSPDVRLVVGDNIQRRSHRIILARFSALLHSVMSELDGEDDVCILLPDISSHQLDRMLQLAYQGSITGLSKADISVISNLCQLLEVNQDQFVVRAESSEDFKYGGSNGSDFEDIFDSEDIGGFDDAPILPPENSPPSKTSQKSVLDGSPAESPTATEGQDEDLENKTELVFRFEHYEHLEEQFYCRFPGCDYREPFKTLGGCKNHQLRYHAREEQKIFLCQFCDKKFASNQLRNKHQNLLHTKRYPCEVCQKVFSEKTRLIIHARTHSGERPYVCEDCGFSCSQKDNLRLHKEFRHPVSGQQEKKFTCDICSASFLTNSNLRRHVLIHSDVKQWVCETCGKSFKDAGSLKQHTFSHGSSEYRCSLCQQSFSSPLYLNRHLSRLHPADGVQPLACQQCGKGFPLKHQLVEHIESVHENKKYRCPHCHLLVGRRTSVARHIKKGRCRVQSMLPPPPPPLSS